MLCIEIDETLYISATCEAARTVQKKRTSMLF